MSKPNIGPKRIEISRSPMQQPQYSVVIRTLGTAGDKYAALLRSIEQQTLAPEEVVVDFQ